MAKVLKSIGKLKEEDGHGMHTGGSRQLFEGCCHNQAAKREEQWILNCLSAL